MHKNAQDFDIMMEYFKTYKEVVDKFGIIQEDQWNFNETGYCMRISKEDWVVLVDIIRRIYSKCLNNQESLTVIECINGVRRDISPILILTNI